jgi:hypothetical protein
MIDPHHRYGSHLKAYHTYWLKHTDNKDNFFQWLDEGDGLNVDLADQGRSRKALDTEKVRYLTREQRLHYLVRVDEKGLLRWAKNDKKIDTTMAFKDSERELLRLMTRMYSLCRLAKRLQHRMEAIQAQIQAPLLQFRQLYLEQNVRTGISTINRE